MAKDNAKQKAPTMADVLGIKAGVETPFAPLTPTADALPEGLVKTARTGRKPGTSAPQGPADPIPAVAPLRRRRAVPKQAPAATIPSWKLAGVADPSIGRVKDPETGEMVRFKMPAGRQPTADELRQVIEAARAARSSGSGEPGSAGLATPDKGLPTTMSLRTTPSVTGLWGKDSISREADPEEPEVHDSRTLQAIRRGLQDVKETGRASTLEARAYAYDMQHLGRPTFGNMEGLPGQYVDARERWLEAQRNALQVENNAKIDAADLEENPAKFSRAAASAEQDDAAQKIREGKMTVERPGTRFAPSREQAVGDALRFVWDWFTSGKYKEDISSATGGQSKASDEQILRPMAGRLVSNVLRESPGVATDSDEQLYARAFDTVFNKPVTLIRAGMGDDRTTDELGPVWSSVETLANFAAPILLTGGVTKALQMGGIVGKTTAPAFGAVLKAIAGRESANEVMRTMASRAGTVILEQAGLNAPGVIPGVKDAGGAVPFAKSFVQSLGAVFDPNAKESARTQSALMLGIGIIGGLGALGRAGGFKGLRVKGRDWSSAVRSAVAEGKLGAGIDAGEAMAAATSLDAMGAQGAAMREKAGGSMEPFFRALPDQMKQELDRVLRELKSSIKVSEADIEFGDLRDFFIGVAHEQTMAGNATHFGKNVLGTLDVEGINTTDGVKGGAGAMPHDLAEAERLALVGDKGPNNDSFTGWRKTIRETGDLPEGREKSALARLYRAMVKDGREGGPATLDEAIEIWRDHQDDPMGGWLARLDAERTAANKEPVAGPVVGKGVKQDLPPENPVGRAPEKSVLDSELWEVPFADLEGRFKREDHRASVEAAIKRGDTVPEKVRADYPELFEDAAKPVAAKVEGTEGAKGTEDAPAPKVDEVKAAADVTEKPVLHNKLVDDVSDVAKGSNKDQVQLEAKKESVSNDRQVKESDNTPAPKVADEVVPAKRFKEQNHTFEEMEVDPRKVGVKPKMQYKRKGIDNLKDAVDTTITKGKEWQRSLGGMITVWEDKAGKQWVMNGHHRRVMALQSGAKTMAARVYREVYADGTPGMTFEEARGMGALHNLAEEKGTAVDGAGVLRDLGYDKDQLQKMGITGPLLRDSLALLKLPKDLLEMVEGGQVGEKVAAALADSGLTGDKLKVAMMHGRNIETAGQAQVLARKIGERPLVVKDDGSGNLFGESVSDSTFVDGAKLEDAVVKRLMSDARLFGRMLKAKEAGGTKVDRIAQKSEADKLLIARETLGTNKALQDAIETEAIAYAKNTTNAQFQGAVDRLVEIAAKGTYSADSGAKGAGVPNVEGGARSSGGAQGSGEGSGKGQLASPPASRGMGDGVAGSGAASQKSESPVKPYPKNADQETKAIWFMGVQKELSKGVRGGDLRLEGSRVVASTPAGKKLLADIVASGYTGTIPDPKMISERLSRFNDAVGRLIDKGMKPGDAVKQAEQDLGALFQQEGFFDDDFELSVPVDPRDAVRKAADATLARFNGDYSKAVIATQRVLDEFKLTQAERKHTQKVFDELMYRHIADANKPLAGGAPVAKPKAPVQESMPGMGDKEGQFSIFDEGLFQMNDKRPVADKRSDKLVALHNTSEDGLRMMLEWGGLPAPSIAIVRAGMPFDNFGEVTLVMRRDVIDPKFGTPVFGSDVYSPRAPRPDWTISPKGRDAWDRGYEGGLGLDRPSIAFSNEYKRMDGRARFLQDAPRMSGTWHMYLLSQGKAIPKMPMKPEPLRILGGLFSKDKVAEFAKGQRIPDGDGPDVRKWATEIVKRGEDEFGVPDLYRRLDDGFVTSTVTNDLIHDIRVLQQGTKVPDIDKFEAMIKKKAFGTRDPRKDPAFGKWLVDWADRIFKEPTVTVGRKKVEYSLDNVVKAMGRAIRGVEGGMTFSHGKARSLGSGRFSSIEAMRKSAWKLASNLEFETWKAENDAHWQKAISELESSGSTFAALDMLSEAVGRSILRGDATPNAMRGAISRVGLNQWLTRSLSDEAIDALVSFANGLKHGPTEYFEAKPMRAVMIHEVAGAVVPKGTSKDLIRRLKEKGLDVREYIRNGRDDPARAEEVQKIKGALWQQAEDQRIAMLQRVGKDKRGMYLWDDTKQRGRVTLFSGSDASTVVHEFAHHLLQVMPKAEQGFIEKWAGVPAGTLSKWNGGRQWRDAHEKFAVAVEARLMSGDFSGVTNRSVRASMERVGAAIKFVYGEGGRRFGDGFDENTLHPTTRAMVDGIVLTPSRKRDLLGMVTVKNAELATVPDEELAKATIAGEIRGRFGERLDVEIPGLDQGSGPPEKKGKTKKEPSPDSAGVSDLSETMYHGGPAGLTELTLRGRGGHDAGGIFLTPSRDYALQYAKGGLYSAEVKGKKIFDARKPADLEKLKDGFLKMVDEGEYDSKESALRDYAEVIKLDLRDWATGSQYVEVMELAGFDGVRFQERPGTIGLAEDGGSTVSGDPIESVALFNGPVKVKPVEGLFQGDYKGEHTAPEKGEGYAPAYDLAGVYPDDFYSAEGLRYYGDGHDADGVSYSALRSLRNRPNAEVTIYRAVPAEKVRNWYKEIAYGRQYGAAKFKEKYGQDYNEFLAEFDLHADEPVTKSTIKINRGDWVTLSRLYAKSHGESALNGNYRIISKKVYARDLFTDGNSIHEFGYDPQPYVARSKGGLFQGDERVPGWTRQVEKVVELMPQERMSVDQLRGWLKGKVKADEMYWSGMDDFLAARAGSDMVTRAEVAWTLDMGQMRVEETLLRDFRRPGGIDTESTRYDNYTLPGGKNYRELVIGVPGTPMSSAKEIGSYKSNHWNAENPVVHMRFKDRVDAQGRRVLFIEEVQSDWHQEGREKGYKDPVALKAIWERRDEIIEKSNDVFRRLMEPLDDAAEALKAAEDGQTKRSMTASSIYRLLNDAYYAVVSANTYFRNSADLSEWDVRVDMGRQKLSMALEELEAFEMALPSGLADKIRDFDAAWDTLGKSRNELLDITGDIRENQKLVRETDRMRTLIERGPFSKSWPELAMKRMMRWAAEEGYDVVAWANGDVHRDRYNKAMADAADEIKIVQNEADSSKIDLVVRKDGKTVFAEAIKREALSDYVGSKMAAEYADAAKAHDFGAGPGESAIPKGDPDYNATYPGRFRHTFKGEGLDVGGHGYRKFYDEILPKLAKDLMRKYGGGADVGKVSIPLSESGRAVDGGLQGWNDGAGGDKPKPAQVADFPGFEVTPELRRTVLEEGLPLFQGENDPVYDADLSALVRAGYVVMSDRPMSKREFAAAMKVALGADSKAWAVADQRMDALYDSVERLVTNNPMLNMKRKGLLAENYAQTMADYRGRKIRMKPVEAVKWFFMDTKSRADWVSRQMESAMGAKKGTFDGTTMDMNWAIDRIKRASGRASQIVEVGWTNKDGKVVQQGLKPLMEAMASSGVHPETFAAYRTARRELALERIGRLEFDAPQDHEWRQAVVDEFESIHGDKIIKLNDEVDAFARKVLETYEDYGLRPPGWAKRIEADSPDYWPLVKEKTPEEKGAMDESGVGGLPEADMKRVGRVGAYADGWDVMARRLERLEHAKAVSDALLPLVDEAVKNPLLSHIVKRLKFVDPEDLKSWTPIVNDDPFASPVEAASASFLDDLLNGFLEKTTKEGLPLVPVARDGRIEYYQVDPLLWAAIRGTMPNQISGLMKKAFKVMAIPSKVFRTFTTGRGNPLFGVLFNPAIDVMSATIGHGYKTGIVMQNWFRGLSAGMTEGKGTASKSKKVQEWSALYNRAVADGAFFMDGVNRDFQSSEWKMIGEGAGKLEVMRKRIERHPIISRVKGSGPGRAIEFVIRIPDAIEKATRISMYEQRLKAYEKQGKAPEFARMRAAQDAIELINFGETGALAKGLTTVGVPYASIPGQVTRSMIKGFKKSPAKFMARAILMLTLPALFEQWAHGDDPEYLDLPDYVKDGMLLWKTGPSQFRGVRIPTELGVFFKGVPRRVLEGRRADDDLKTIGSGILAAIGKQFMPPVMPTWASAIAQEGIFQNSGAVVDLSFQRPLTMGGTDAPDADRVRKQQRLQIGTTMGATGRTAYDFASVAMGRSKKGPDLMQRFAPRPDWPSYRLSGTARAYLTSLGVSVGDASRGAIEGVKETDDDFRSRVALESQLINDFVRKDAIPGKLDAETVKAAIEEIKREVTGGAKADDWNPPKTTFEAIGRKRKRNVSLADVLMAR